MSLQTVAALPLPALQGRNSLPCPLRVFLLRCRVRPRDQRSANFRQGKGKLVDSALTLSAHPHPTPSHDALLAKATIGISVL